MQLRKESLKKSGLPGLVGKQTIYQCRKKLIKPSFALFLAKIDHLKSLEYQTAKKRRKLATFFDKWKNVQ